MRALPNDLRRQLESAVLEGRRIAEGGVRATLSSLGVSEREKPGHLDEVQARLRRGLRAKCRQLGGHPEQDPEVLVWDAAYEQWHRLLFARFLAENGLLRHPEFGAPVTLADCDDLADDLGEPDGWSVAARFAAEILPGIFRLDDPCLHLRLAPEHRVALETIVAGLPAEVFAADDSLGWVYQYWQSERKDQVNASEVKIGGADLGPVTQLFTENYMVRFLLENSLGAWWAARNPSSPLVKEFEFLRFDDDGHPAAGNFGGWPDSVADVTVMDPCCGSGHFLVEAFGMLWRMRAEEEGLDPVVAQDAVLRDNLFGLELDPRCVQIAMFAVALTAWRQGGGWRELPTPNIACSGIPAKAPLEDWTALADGDERLIHALERLHALFKDADTLGSLIDPRRAAEMGNAAGPQKTMWDVDFDEVAPLLDEAASRETDDPATSVLGADAAGIARAAALLSRRYSLVATNVPYLTRNKMGGTLKAFVDARHGSARADLATVFLHRMWSLLGHEGTQATVSPQNWTYLSRYADFRADTIRQHRLNLVARLGAGAFDAIGGWVVNILLLVASGQPWSGDVASVDVTELGTARKKAEGLQGRPVESCRQQTQLDNPDARLTFVDPGTGLTFLSEVAEGLGGITTGDSARLRRYHWELPEVGNGWVRQQSSPSKTVPYGGRELVLRWEHGEGVLTAAAAEGRATVAGRGAWGKRGVAFQKMGDLPCTIYTGEHYENVIVVVVPKDDSVFPALWRFAESGQLAERVREIDQSVGVTCNTMVKVPFELDHWQEVAEEAGPIPEPWSDDPTQWLFEGRPEVAAKPLHVAVGRLVGYRWPEQVDDDHLVALADTDGIACLPPVGGEMEADKRLTALLVRAYGAEWSPALLRHLLEQAGTKKKTLADWLLDDFFKGHCAVFSHRPFVWHVWDGRKDGFSALVNYHRLDRAGLEKLTYTYLGDWTERQRADAAEEVAGADGRLAAARELKGKLEAILEGEPPYDIYVRWKELHEQPIGWDPDLDDGVRLNIRPFVEAGVLRSKVNVHWKKDRGKNPDGSERHNDLHYTNDQKRQARQKAGST